MTEPPTRWLTTREAAAVLGVTPIRVRQLCQAGRIVGAQRVPDPWRGQQTVWLIPAPVRVLPP